MLLYIKCLNCQDIHCEINAVYSRTENRLNKQFENGSTYLMNFMKNGAVIMQMIRDIRGIKISFTMNAYLQLRA